MDNQNNKFIIPHRLPSLNDYINACRSNRYSGAELKLETDVAVCLAIKNAVRTGTLRPPKPPVRLAFTWHESTKRRDADNVASAKKYILDAMQATSIIPNDSRKYVVGFSDEIVDDTRDYVEVEIFEVARA